MTLPPGVRPQKARIWFDSISEGGSCRSCQQPIVWAQLCKSGKKMPFDSLEVIKTGVLDDEGVERTYQTVSLKTVHWGTCPHARQWKQRPLDPAGEAAPIQRVPNVREAIGELQHARDWLRAHWRETGQHPRLNDIGQAVARALRHLTGDRP